MRILWVSDSPTSPSGFGVVTAAICRRLAARGHQVEILGWQNRGFDTRWEGIPVHPVRRDLFGSDVLLGYLYRTRPHFLITLADVWWMSFLADPPVQRYLDMSGTRWVLYYPIDGADPDMRLPAGWVRMLQTADVPVAMTHFGVEVSTTCGVEPAYIPHGCDVDLFAPPANKEAAKARLGYQGRFVVLSDARNQPRKLLPRALDIVETFARDKPDVVAHLHCDPEDDAATSPLYHYRIKADVEMLGLADVVSFTPAFRMRSASGLPQEALAAIYAAADVHLLCSWGEGFGLPTLQAASAGVVPIAPDYSGNPELVGEHGFAVPAESALLDEFGLVRCLLSREAAVSALELLYADRELLAERSRQARQFALDYQWDAVVDRWERMLATAPPRRRPVRSRSFTWVAGDDHHEARDTTTDLVRAATSSALAKLPDGAKVEMHMTERRFGEVTQQIKREAFQGGDRLSIPVRLPPAFEGVPRAGIGRVLASPGDLPLVARLQPIFPGIAISVPMSSGDIQAASFLPLEQLVPTLPHYALVMDHSREAPAHLDLACAALGVPYAGSSHLWPEIPADSPLLAVRLLLTDQGLSEWRRQVAVERAVLLTGPQTVEGIRALALAGQPEPREETAPAPDQGRSRFEMFMVRPRPGAPPAAVARIASFADDLGGVILLETDRFVIVTLPAGGKERLEAEPLVGLIGGITLDEEGKAARSMKELLMTNATRHLASKLGRATSGGEGPDSQTTREITTAGRSRQ